MSIFSSRLEHLRKGKGWTKTYTGKMLGLALTTYANYEYGEREPDFNMLTQIAALFNTTTDYLTGRTDDPSPASSNASAITSSDLDKMIDNARSFDGKPMDDHDREVIKNMLKGYYIGKEGR